MTEDEMVGWHHRFSGQEFEQAPANGEEQGTLECCSPWGHKESTEHLSLSLHKVLSPAPNTVQAQ